MMTLKTYRLALSAFVVLSLAACGGGSPQYTEAQVARGAEAFAVCAACHQVSEGGSQLVGPNLWGVYGAKPAFQDGFTYSPALTNASLVWDNATLDAYLENPSAAVPGGRMIFPGVKDAETRQDIIAYLSTRR